MAFSYSNGLLAQILDANAVSPPVVRGVLRIPNADEERDGGHLDVVRGLLVHVAQLQPAVVLLLPVQQRIARLELRLVLGVLDQEAVEQLVLDRLRVAVRVRQNISVRDIVHEWDRAELLRVLAGRQEGDRFGLRSNKRAVSEVHEHLVVGLTVRFLFADVVELDAVLVDHPGRERCGGLVCFVRLRHLTSENRSRESRNTSLLSRPFVWHVLVVDLRFPGKQNDASVAEYSVKKHLTSFVVVQLRGFQFADFGQTGFGLERRRDGLVNATKREKQNLGLNFEIRSIFIDNIHLK